MNQFPISLLAAAGAWLFAGSAAAHSVWAVPEAPGVFRVLFGGHADKLESYDPARLKTVQAWDAAGRPVAVARSDAADGVRLKPASAPALVAMHYDNGIHARTPEGRSVNKPMDQVPGSRRATFAVKYHKLILQWTDFVVKPLGQPFEVTPLEAKPAVAGQPLRVRVTLDGKPAPGIKLGRGEDRIEAETDASGIASVTPAKGFNRIWAGQRMPVSGNPAYTELSYEYAFTFEAQ